MASSGSKSLPQRMKVCYFCRWWRRDGVEKEGIAGREQAGNCCKYHPVAGRFQVIGSWFCREFELREAVVIENEVRMELEVKPGC